MIAIDLDDGEVREQIGAEHRCRRVGSPPTGSSTGPATWPLSASSDTRTVSGGNAARHQPRRIARDQQAVGLDSGPAAW